MSAVKISLVILVFTVLPIYCRPLSDYFHDLEEKQNAIKMREMMDFIAKNIPEGLDVPQPKVAEYETFKSNKMSNFIDDGSGHLHFRQFRRLNLGNVMGRRLNGIV